MNIAVGFDNNALASEAQQLAERLKLPLDNQAKNCLLLRDDGLFFKISPFAPLRANFTFDYWNKRKLQGKRQALIKACQPKIGVTILDLTAGWGRDAAILAIFGAKVHMIERNPIIAALLKDALARQDLEASNSLSLSLENTDALTYLSQLEDAHRPDVIYVDPMHPSRQKAALVKKDLQVLQRLVGPDEDAQHVIESAIKKAIGRVVVKWPQHLSPLIKPSFSIPGKTVRFDVYMLFHSEFAPMTAQ
jgi:16S rRNA (guanine1516-N2)-methyltransferase